CKNVRRSSIRHGIKPAKPGIHGRGGWPDRGLSQITERGIPYGNASPSTKVATGRARKQGAWWKGFIPTAPSIQNFKSKKKQPSPARYRTRLSIDSKKGTQLFPSSELTSPIWCH